MAILTTLMYLHQSDILVMVMAAATVFVALLALGDPESSKARMGVYLSGLFANQGTSMLGGVALLIRGDEVTDIPLSASDVVAFAGMATIAVATFYLVRTWISPGGRRPCHREAHWRNVIGPGATAVVAFLIALYASGLMWTMCTTLLGLAEPIDRFDVSTFHDWMLDSACNVLAGVIEEPIYTGLVVALWRNALRDGSFLRLALLTGTARGIMHLYYAAGVEPVTNAIVLVIFWCCLWSGASLYLVYRTRLLWPVVAAHGLYNVVIGTYERQLDLEGNLMNVALFFAPGLALVAVFAIAGRYQFRRFRGDRHGEAESRSG